MDLTNFLQHLSVTSELKVINAKVASNLELAAICRREFANENGGSALLFKQVDGYDFSVAANLFGNESRTSRAISCDSYSHFSTKLKQYLSAKTGTAIERLASSTTNADNSLSVENKLQFLTGLNLNDLPTIRSWPQENRGYLNLALTMTAHPETAKANLGLYRAQILDSKRLAINFSSSSGAAEHLKVAAAENKKLPVSLVLGGETALLWAAAAPLPKDCDEFSFVKDLFGHTIKMTSALSQSLDVPANAELIIEGEICPGNVATEGPFGNHSGQYVSRVDCPVMDVTAIRYKDTAIVPVTVVGPPPSENTNLAQLNKILIKQMLQIDFPQIADIEMPIDTIFHGVTMLALAQQSSQQNRELIAALWKSSPIRNSRLIVLLDEDIDLKSASNCWWRTINMLKEQKLYQAGDCVAIDATGINPANLVNEDLNTKELLLRRKDEYSL